MPYIPERFPRYKDYVMPPFPALKKDLSGQYDKIKNFDSRDSDILICTFPKSGTNWVNEIISMMMRGSAEYDTVYKHTAMLEALNDFGALEQIPESTTRILNSHIPLGDLPPKHIENGYRIVHVMRNPKDVAVSFYNHMANIKDMTTMKPSTDFPISWPLFIEHFGQGEEQLYGGWFNYVKTFEKAKETGKLSNVFTIYYEQLKQDPMPILKALAAFLGVEASDELLEEINDKCSFQKMSTIGEEGKDNTLVKKMSTTGKNFLFRKGEIGDWKNWFTVAQNEAFTSLIETQMKDSKLKFIFE
ncbi:sulfotransferase family cytosolic 1B member 1-like [Pecten maximus]|uniref:sulfotransferase family cytosolic 1B member 1-like n=1 Tax=Pecten maximus TaxID=6579 RepID=UPI001457E6EC|nr:sulfotransferase family cytosolic 1B member 1-like [Pecten maximus]